MNDAVISAILQAHNVLKRQIKISVTGVSMNPTLYEGDCITVLSQDSYQIGDILVFRYRRNELLVHRLLNIHSEMYICKGDNAFCLEVVSFEAIVGKVIQASRGVVNLEIDISDKALALSLKVNQEFMRQNRDINKTKMSEVYESYCKKILGDKAHETVRKKQI